VTPRRRRARSTRFGLCVPELTVSIELRPVLFWIGDARRRVRGEAMSDHVIDFLAGQSGQDRAASSTGRQRERLVELDHVADRLGAVDFVLKHDLLITPPGEVGGLIEAIGECVRQRCGGEPEGITLSHCGRDREHLAPHCVGPAFVDLLYPSQALELTEDPAAERSMPVTRSASRAPMPPSWRPTRPRSVTTRWATVGDDAEPSTGSGWRRSFSGMVMGLPFPLIYGKIESGVRCCHDHRRLST
jgi:hypothetical protein